VGGVVFGYFAGITYWFPKYVGFRLNERLGAYAFWCWLSGFVLAFVPLYILGFMGATRRLDHYDSSLGWQGLFIVAGIGALIIMCGVGFQILQIAVSILQRKQNMDTTGDPWDGRTLEWSTVSPPPFYNFAVLPEVTERDTYWEQKQHPVHHKTQYEDIELPKNSMLGMVIALGALMFGFAMVWHILWLAIVGFLLIILTVIIRISDDDKEYILTAAEVEKMELGKL